MKNRLCVTNTKMIQSHKVTGSKTTKIKAPFLYKLSSLLDLKFMGEAV